MEGPKEGGEGGGEAEDPSALDTPSKEGEDDEEAEDEEGEEDLNYNDELLLSLQLEDESEEDIKGREAKRYWEKICNANMGASALDCDENDLEECEEGSSEVAQALIVQVSNNMLSYLMLCAY